MKFLFSLLITTSALACPDYYLIPDISSAYENPTKEKIAEAQAEAVHHFGYNDELPFKDKSVFSSTYFETKFANLTLHAEAAGALSCLDEKIEACKFDGDILPAQDSVLNLHKLKLGIKLSKKNDCFKKLLTNNGFYPLKDENFIFIGKAEKKSDELCPYNMVAIKSSGRCMDKFEAPNVKGVKPFVARTAKEGIAYCELQGKELCTDVAWENACQNEEEKTPVPYGAVYKNGKCNDDKVWRSPKWGLINKYDPNHPDSNPVARDHTYSLNQVDASGSHPECKTNSEIYDLTGNAAEWVYNTKKKANTENGDVYTVVMKGCYWAKCLNGINPSCKFTNSNHGPTFRSYEASFRCCTKL